MVTREEINRVTESPWEQSPSGMSATIKARGSSNDGPPWIVFHGSPGSIRQQVIDFFGYDPAGLAELTDSEVFLNACTDFRAAFDVANGGTGGRAIRSSRSKSSTKSASVAEGGATEDVWSDDDSQQAEPEPERNPLLDAIEASTTVDALKRLWAENKPEFESDEALMATWKAKGKALSGK